MTTIWPFLGNETEEGTDSGIDSWQTWCLKEGKPSPFGQFIVYLLSKSIALLDHSGSASQNGLFVFDLGAVKE
jgi:hypothetical protein